MVMRVVRGWGRAPTPKRFSVKWLLVRAGSEKRNVAGQRVEPVTHDMPLPPGFH